jgi:hypothetical protein
LPAAANRKFETSRYHPDQIILHYTIRLFRLSSSFRPVCTKTSQILSTGPYFDETLLIRPWQSVRLRFWHLFNDSLIWHYRQGTINPVAHSESQAHPKSLCTLTQSVYLFFVALRLRSTICGRYRPWQTINRPVKSRDACIIIGQVAFCDVVPVICYLW